MSDTLRDAKIADLARRVDELCEAAREVVNVLQECWENAPNELEYVVGKLALRLQEPPQ